MSTRFFSLAASALVLAACSTFSSAPAPVEAAAPAFSSDRFSVVASGEGEPIVFVPGLASSPRAFEGVTDDLPGSVHLVTVAGFGDTAAPAELDPFVQPIADELKRYLASERATNAVLVGHSMGGVVAMLTAAQTERVGGVVIVDSVPFLSGFFQPGATPEQAAALRPAMAAQFAGMTDLQWTLFARQGLMTQSISEEGRARVSADSERANVAAQQAAFIDLMTNDYTEVFRMVDVPVLVLVPFDETAGLPKETILQRYEEQYADMPWVRIKMIEGSRHFITFDQPEAFREALDAFLEGGSQ